MLRISAEELEAEFLEQSEIIMESFYGLAGTLQATSAGVTPPRTSSIIAGDGGVGNSLGTAAGGGMGGSIQPRVMVRRSYRLWKELRSLQLYCWQRADETERALLAEIARMQAKLSKPAPSLLGRAWQSVQALWASVRPVPRSPVDSDAAVLNPARRCQDGMWMQMHSVFQSFPLRRLMYARAWTHYNRQANIGGFIHQLLHNPVRATASLPPWPSMLVETESVTSGTDRYVSDDEFTPGLGPTPHHMPRVTSRQRLGSDALTSAISGQIVEEEDGHNEEHDDEGNGDSDDEATSGGMERESGMSWGSDGGDSGMEGELPSLAEYNTAASAAGVTARRQLLARLSEASIETEGLLGSGGGEGSCAHEHRVDATDNDGEETQHLPTTPTSKSPAGVAAEETASDDPVTPRGGTPHTFAGMNSPAMTASYVYVPSDVTPASGGEGAGAGVGGVSGSGRQGGRSAPSDMSRSWFVVADDERDEEAGGEEEEEEG